MTTYRETFDHDNGGWFGWRAEGNHVLENRNGAIVSQSPWWVDYNHAPPGGGYLHILFGIHTHAGFEHNPGAGPNRFLEGNCPTDFRNARIEVTIKGDVDLKDAQMVLLAQADVTSPKPARVNSVLSSQPIQIMRDWSTQTITCEPDNDQWTCLGSRHDRMALYGWGPIEPVLGDLNVDIIFVLWPLDIVPVQPVEGDMHVQRAGEDYEVEAARLPAGEVLMDEIAIHFAE